MRGGTTVKKCYVLKAINNKIAPSQNTENPKAPAHVIFENASKNLIIIGHLLLKVLPSPLRRGPGRKHMKSGLQERGRVSLT